MNKDAKRARRLAHLLLMKGKRRAARNYRQIAEACDAKP